MSPPRLLPHRPLPGSVRPQDVPRLIRLRERLSRRWQRRQRRLVVYFGIAFALAFVALVAIGSLLITFLIAPADGTRYRDVELGSLVFFSLGVLSLAIYAMWRFDRTGRRARGARIRLHQTMRRLASIPGAPDGVTRERRVG